MRRMLAAAATSFVLSSAALAEGVRIDRSGSKPSAIGSAAHFVGHVVVDPFYEAKTSLGGHVSFAPGARTAWHTHPAGQVLIVTDGTGWIQEDGGARREIRSGDVVSIAAGVRHWHGATSSTAMRHIAITNLQDGKGVDWLEQVTDAQFGN
ncbi:hypothetical protein FG93_01163 [Bosea sp. LC85]|uniref:(R)-mandelonitrile lyase n=1 Tax=Bosea sp. LC85 TaxID=1502851 RepID=UPI0004E2B809|nr:cupin domain-containing protein [Bosea sp. LC85]KFC74577.1 hypothetical protein FG93_01163 [Bosea sp. LC85]